MVKAFFSAIVLVFASLIGLHHAQPAAVAPVAIVQSPSVHSLSVPSLSVAAIDLAPATAAPTVAPATIRSSAPATPEGGLVLGAATSVPDTVTHAELTAALEQLSNSVQSQLSSVTAPAQSFSGSPASTPVSFQTFATSQNIDQLANVTITNATVHGVSGLTAADIPTDLIASNYLPLTSGANDIDVFLIAGQSNAEGYNNTTSGPAITPGTALQYYNGAISPANDPVGNASTGSAWPQFAISYYAKTGHRIAFVPTAIPSSALLAAANLGTGYWGTGGTLFNTSVTQVNAAVGALRAAGYVPHFVGVLWDQGESDALAINGSIITGPTYQSALQTLIGNYRTQFGANVPFYIFRTGTFTTQSDTGFAAVRSAEEAVAAGDHNTFIVFRNAIDFPARGLMNGDGAHYTQAGYNEMGRVGAETIADRTSVPHWQDQSSNLVFDTSGGGHVGIGTTSPAYALDVAGFINTDQFSGFKQAGNTILYASTTNYSVSVGVGAGLALNASGLYNTAIGENALAVATSSGLNTAVGVNALNANTTGNNNTALGVAALYANTTGINNVAGGVSAMQSNTIGQNNVALGQGAMFLNASGSGNIGVGTGALGSQTTAFGNVGIGYNAGHFVTTGAGNILIGAATSSANANLTTGYGNISIGNNMQLPSATGSYQLDIGNLIYATNINGTGSTLSAGKVGIGTTSPEATLTVVGSICAARGAGTQTTPCSNATGEIDASASSLSGGYDVAEAYPTSDSSLQAGDIITFDPSAPGSVIRAATADVAFLGVISTNPALTLGVVSSSTRAIALAGRVPVKVNLDGGPISIGDPITLSTVPGIGARATTTEETIGVALAPYDGTGSSTIDVFVRPGLASPKSAGGVSGFLGSIFSQITAWLGNAGNGITNIFAQTITATNVTADTGTFQKLCMTKSGGSPVCITGDALDQILTNENVSAGAASTPSAATPSSSPSASSGPTASTSPAVDEATSTSSSNSDATSSLPILDAAPPLAPDYHGATTALPSAATTTN